MAYNEGQLNGSADYRVYLDVSLVSQNGAANQSVLRWAVGMLNPNGQTGWFNDYTASWSVNIAGGGASGAFNWPNAGTRSRELSAGYITMGHDAEGYLPAFSNSAYIDTPHSAMGDGGVSLWADAPRIAKRPAPAGVPTFSEITNDSVRVSWAGSPDSRGAAIDSYLLRIWENTEASGPYTDHSTQLNTSRVVTGLTPGKTYTFGVYAHNGATYDSGGFANVSPVATVSLLAGVFVSDGTTWVPQPMRDSDGAAWVNMMPTISDGDSWEEPLDV